MIISFIAALALQSAADPLIEHALQVDTGEIQYTTYFEADGTYTTSIGISGTWSLDGDQFCVERESGEANCQPLMEGLSVGDSWTGQNADGSEVTFTLVARD